MRQSTVAEALTAAGCIFGEDECYKTVKKSGLQSLADF
jgi:hypothetical protein